MLDKNFVSYGQLDTFVHYFGQHSQISRCMQPYIFIDATSTIPSAVEIELAGSEKGDGKEISPALDNSKHSPTCGVQNSLQEKCFMCLAIISPLDDKSSS